MLFCELTSQVEQTVIANLRLKNSQVQGFCQRLSTNCWRKISALKNHFTIFSLFNFTWISKILKIWKSPCFIISLFPFIFVVPKLHFQSLHPWGFLIARLMVEIVFLSKRKKWNIPATSSTVVHFYQNAIKLNIFFIAYLLFYFFIPQMLLIIIIFHVKTSRSFSRLNFMFE